MRVTQNYSVTSLLQSVAASRERIYTLQQNLATGKRVNKISDDPEHIETVMRYKNLLRANEQFRQNLENALDFMYISTQALDDAVDTMSYAKELAVQGITPTSEEEWTSMAEQVNQMLKQMVDLANTRFKDRYVFGGTYSSEQPFTLSSDESQVLVNPHGVDGALKIEYGDSRVAQYNVSGQDAFLQPSNIFQTLIDLRDAFSDQDSAALQNLVDDLDSGIDQLVQQNGKLGAQIKRHELYLEQYQNQDVRLQGFLSKVEDTDMAQSITELQLEQTGLTTALQVLAKTLNVSLVDFIS